MSPRLRSVLHLLALAVMGLVLFLLPFDRWLPPRQAIWLPYVLIPVMCGGIALIARVGGPPQPPRPGSSMSLFIAAGLLVACFIVDYSFVFIGQKTGMSYMTYGNHRLLDRMATTALWAFPLTIAAGIFGFEWGLRRVLLVEANRWLPTSVSIPAVSLAGTLLFLPFLNTLWDFQSYGTFAALMVSVLCREVVLSCVYTTTGNVWLTGFYRGVLYFIWGFLINDTSSDMYPVAVYSSSGGTFSVVQSVTAILSAGLAVGATFLVTRKQRHETKD